MLDAMIPEDFFGEADDDVLLKGGLTSENGGCISLR
jgi:hypothetical protein